MLLCTVQLQYCICYVIVQNRFWFYMGLQTSLVRAFPQDPFPAYHFPEC